MRLRRILATVGLAGRRVVGRFRVEPQRLLLSALGVALAVGLMITVTGISVGLASQSLIESEDVDYWVVPENADVQSLVVSTGGLQIGNTHTAANQIAANLSHGYATPVLIELLPVTDTTTHEKTYLLAVGVVPPAQTTSILGLPTTPLTPGDPYYQNGSYNGTWTSEIVLSDAAATLTNASTGTTLDVAGPNTTRSFTVTTVASADLNAAVGSTPVALVHLSELQTLTGATEGDQANQLLVETNTRAVKDRLEHRYPRKQVIAKRGLAVQPLTNSKLPLAVAVGAFITALTVGILFVTTLMGLEVSADRQQLGTLAALGFSRRTRSLVIAAETITTSLLGGVAGIGLGYLGIIGVNRFGNELFNVGSIAVFQPVFILYALLVAGCIGLIGTVYPVLVGRRTDPLEVLS